MFPKSSWRSLALLSVKTILFFRMANSLFMTLVWIGLPIIKRAKPARAEGPKLINSNAKQIHIWMGAAQNMWNQLAQKSIRDTSVDMWFTSFPFVNVDRARDVYRRERLYIAWIRPPLRRTPIYVRVITNQLDITETFTSRSRSVEKLMGAGRGQQLQG